MDDLAPCATPERPEALSHHPARDKVLPLREAIRRHVSSGASIALGTCLEQMIPFAAAHEIARQRIGDLTLIGPVSDIAFDQLIGSGLVRRVMAAWVGNVMMGSAYAYRRAVERNVPRAIEVVEFSNFTLAQALHAAAIGAPFLPTRSALGSDIVGRNPYLAPISDPLGGGPLLAIRPLHPDVAIVHVQRADTHGNGIMWGSIGITVDAVRAARTVIVTAEEIVTPDQTRRDPNRVVIPGIVVTAVCEARWGAHPSPVQGYYRRDHEAYAEYHRVTKTEDGFARWREEWVDGVGDLQGYVARLGNERVAALIPVEHRYPEPVDYGY
ncbi:MAG: CoA transferase subunit A [Candidatus Latescibacteria bacterium]|nr:CoA transferase subunit A [Candidatus Latescibacterota bacterium]